MRQVLSIARKELRAYFVSPVALIFLGVFLFVVMFSFFWVDTFFRRNVADVRPLFHWLPLLLLFLVAALTMRLWSEEQRSGTLEILMTMPVRTSRLVLGKFLAGLALVGLALLLTISLPVTVSLLGDLDWGPVAGGYIAALLLAGAYLAIGLCVSSTTNNPIVALLVTTIGCLALWGIGTDSVAGLGGTRVGEILRGLGTGARFESIGRGVLDLRDILYYLSLTVGFLYLNTVILEAKRWSFGESTRRRRASIKASAVLVIANLLVVNVAFAGVRRARIDLTERGDYSISKVTRNLLEGLDEPLLIRGYFSAKTHPLLAPLVPRIRDMLEEYAAVGGPNVKVEMVDPQQSPEAEKEANEDYGIKSVPFQFADRHEAAVVNSYFTILVKYGDKFEKLGFQDLIEVKVTGIRDVEVRLRNLEYDLTRTIKKVVYGFQPLDSAFARTSGGYEVTLYTTPKTLPKQLREVAEHLSKAAREIAAHSGGKLTFNEVDPSGPANEALRRKLLTSYGFKPMVASLFATDSFYLHVLIKQGDRHGAFSPAPTESEADLRRDLESAIKRLAPGFLKTVGLVVSTAPSTPPNPMMRQDPRMQGPSRHFELLRQQLSDNYTVKNIDLKSGRVPGDVDVLLVIGPDPLDTKARFAIDQFLMRGGSVIACDGAYSLDPNGTGGLSMQRRDSKLDSLLETWGIKIEPKLVLDPQNEAFPIPVERNVMGMTVPEIRMLRYPFWVDIRSSGMAESNPVVAGLPSVTMQWASPLELSQKKGIESTVLLRSSEGAWTQSTGEVQPDFAKYPQTGFGAADNAKTGAMVLAALETGVFPSAFAGQPNPLVEKGKDGAAANAASGAAAQKNASAGVIEKSQSTARLAVVGSTDFVQDAVLNLSRQTGSDRFNNNLQLLQNLVDWSVADVDLLSIRSRGTYARTLEPLEASVASAWELGNYAFVVLCIGLIVGLTYLRRRSLQPMQLVSSSDGAQES